jgi:CHAD domain-containing protein
VTLTIGELARAALSQHVHVLLDREEGVRDGRDIEDVHQMRVATRRLRAGLKLFGPFVPGDADALREELSWLASALGEVRDLDVQLAALLHAAQDLHASPEAFAPLAGWFRARHLTARQALIESLDAERFGQLRTALLAVINEPPAESGLAADAAEGVLPELLGANYRRFRKAAADLDEHSPAPQLHRARIRAKQLRYSLEFSADVYGKPARELIRVAVDAQDALGAIQDAVVMEDRLREIGEGGHELPPASIFVAGQLAQHFADGQHAARSEVPHALRGLLRKQWRRLEHDFSSAPPPASEDAEPPNADS